MLRIAEHVRQDTVTNRPDTRTSMSFCPQAGSGECDPCSPSWGLGTDGRRRPDDILRSRQFLLQSPDVVAEFR